MDYKTEALKKHQEWAGKLEIVPKMAITNRAELSLAHTPGVAEPCLAIYKDINKSYELTGRGNTVAIITDGSAVLGLGDIGPEAAMPVMEGKAVLFKRFGGINAVPLCVRSKNIEEIIQVVQLLSGSFGGILLEDISAPRCFEIEKRLKETCDIPVFHDDQHGTSIIILAALINALKVTNKQLDKVKIVINGAGAAGIAVASFLAQLGVGELIVCDRLGSIWAGRKCLNFAKDKLASVTNINSIKGSLADCLVGADVFIGVSCGNVVTFDMVRTMAEGAILFTMANPVPEIMPDVALKAGAAVVGTGRSDFVNQINNALAFPAVFRGALDVLASDINSEMKLAAAKALAELVTDDELRFDYIIPSLFDTRIKEVVALAVAVAARKTGVNRK